MKINANLDKVLCPNCRNRIEALDTGVSLFECGSCGHGFPVVEGRFPLLIDDSRGILISSHIAHESLVQENESLINDIKEAVERDPARDSLLSRVIDAYGENNQYFQRTLDTIRRLLPGHDFGNVRLSENLPEQYPIDNGLLCLCRDWSWESCTEQEIRTIMTTLFSLVDKCAFDLHSVFVPGAGTGRFACEAAVRYDECYALDNTFHMVNDFYNILDHEVNVYDINLYRNVVRSENVVQKRRLSFLPRDGDSSVPTSALENLCFFVGDALCAPFPDNFFSAIMCIYFIDGVPIKAQIEHADRLLKPGGLFLNFGPLRYFGSDINNMLSGEEILLAFKDSGFDILATDVVNNTQYADPVTLTQIESRNFVFAARKRP